MHSQMVALVAFLFGCGLIYGLIWSRMPEKLPGYVYICVLFSLAVGIITYNLCHLLDVKL